MNILDIIVGRKYIIVKPTEERNWNDEMDRLVGSVITVSGIYDHLSDPKISFEEELNINLLYPEELEPLVGDWDK